jgi:hypothetical protein
VRHRITLVDIWRAVREGRLATVSEGEQQVLGRKTVSFERWAQENVAAFQ